MMSDPVHSPAHYTAGAVECIDAIEAAMTNEEFVGFLRGQMIKYVWRLGRKGDGLEDVEKALWYGGRLANKLDEMKAEAEDDDAFIASLAEAEPARRLEGADPEAWLKLGGMVARAQKSEAEREEMATFSDRAAGTPLSIAELENMRQSLRAEIDGIIRDGAAIEAKEAELRKLSNLEDTDGNVVLMYTDHVDWDEAPEWANFLAYDDVDPTAAAGNLGSRAYWFEFRPTWRDASRYWASGGQGGRIQFAEPYSGYGGDPRLFVRAMG